MGQHLGTYSIDRNPQTAQSPLAVQLHTSSEADGMDESEQLGGMPQTYGDSTPTWHDLNTNVCRVLRRVDRKERTGPGTISAAGDDLCFNTARLQFAHQFPNLAADKTGPTDAEA